MSFESPWRKHAAEVIEQVLQENKGKDEKEIRKAIRKAYPFGERKYHPYKIWCDQARKMLGKKGMTMKKLANPNPEQTELFKP